MCDNGKIWGLLYAVIQCFMPYGQNAVFYAHSTTPDPLRGIVHHRRFSVADECPAHTNIRWSQSSTIIYPLRGTIRDICVVARTVVD